MLSYASLGDDLADQIRRYPNLEDPGLLLQLNRSLDRSVPILEAEYKKSTDTVVDQSVLASGASLLAIGAVGVTFRGSRAVKADTVVPMFQTGSPVDGKVISEKIWDISKKADLLIDVKKGVNAGLSADEIAESVSKYLRVGRGYNDAYRLAYTELTWGYETTSVNSARNYNTQDLGFEIGIRQSVSPAHAIYDICDELQGVYRLDQNIPAIPRHPRCICRQDQVILNRRTKTVSYNQQVKKINRLPESKSKSVNLGTVTLL
jgi:hypothetical protein